MSTSPSGHLEETTHERDQLLELLQVLQRPSGAGVLLLAFEALDVSKQQLESSVQATVHAVLAEPNLPMGQAVVEPLVPTKLSEEAVHVQSEPQPLTKQTEVEA